MGVPSYLSALGEASTGPVDVVIGPVDRFPGSAESVVRGLRALSPGARLIALCNQDSAARGKQAVQAGFDHCLVEPVEAGELSELIGATGASASARATGEITDNGNGEQLDQHTQANPPPDADNQDLGDIDLVESLLTCDGDLCGVAVRIVSANSGIAGVGLCLVDGQPPKTDVSVSVDYRGRCFGRLHAPAPATTQQLAAWAGWLGRWLALQNQVAQLGDMALRDELTGIWNRRYFNRFLDRILRRASVDRSPVTLLVFDIDDFKVYNDAYGHGMGDEVLCETARMMASVVREHDVVARIGGDEFAVIFWDNDKPRRPNSSHPQDVVAAARRFQEAICSHRFPKLLDKAPGQLTVSGGLASFPWDGRTPGELMARADAMAMQSKRQGKNAITFGTGAKRRCPDD